MDSVSHGSSARDKLIEKVLAIKTSTGLSLSYEQAAKIVDTLLLDSIDHSVLDALKSSTSPIEASGHPESKVSENDSGRDRNNFTIDVASMLFRGLDIQVGLSTDSL